MTTRITALDGSEDFTEPRLVVEYSADAESGNEIHQMIAPGSIAVTLVGDLPRSGALHLKYDDDAAAAEARELLARPAAFVLEDTDRPVVDMTFVRAGVMTTSIHREVEQVWEFAVGFQEVPE